MEGMRSNSSHGESLTIEDLRTDRNYALHWASKNGHLEIVKYLKEIYIKNGREEYIPFSIK